MKYSDIIIEVKTKWMEDNNNYYRDIIEYKIDCNEATPKEIAVKYINEIGKIQEKANKIDNNTIVINLLDKNRNELKIDNDILEYILNYTKYQWEA